MTTRLLLVDDHTLFRESVARLLNSEQGFEVVAHCGSVQDALEIVRTKSIDLVLLDWDLGSEKGSDFVNRAKETGFVGKVLLVTAGISDNRTTELIRKGIAGVFTKHRPLELLVQGIREVMEGKVWFEHQVLANALEEKGIHSGGRSSFTERERLVLSLVFEGLSNKEIAEQLHVSESSVKASLQQLFAKTGVRSRSQLVRVTLEEYRDQL